MYTPSYYKFLPNYLIYLGAGLVSSEAYLCSYFEIIEGENGRFIF